MALAEQSDAVFLPGPAAARTVRYAPLLAALGNGPQLVTKDLDLAAEAGPPEDYGVEMQIRANDRFADERDLHRLHPYGHSAGRSVALAYAAERGTACSAEGRSSTASRSAASP